MWLSERRIKKKYRRGQEEARKSGDRKRVDDVESEYDWHMWELSDDRRFHIQEKTIRKALRMGLEVPWRSEAAQIKNVEDENWRMGTNGEW